VQKIEAKIDAKNERFDEMIEQRFDEMIAKTDDFDENRNQGIFRRTLRKFARFMSF
jgi:hypothetical protein